MWKGCHDGLSTKDRREKCKVFLPQHCLLCCNASELLSHICFQCRFTLDIIAWILMKMMASPFFLRGLTSLRLSPFIISSIHVFLAILSVISLNFILYEGLFGSSEIESSLLMRVFLPIKLVFK